MLVVLKISRKLLVVGSIFLLLAVFGISHHRFVTAKSVPTPIESIKTNEKVIALTINVDWGEEYIPQILDILDQHDAKVTFFVTGRWAKNHQDLLKLMAERGHLIENHGYSHPHPDQISVQANIEEIKKTESIILEVIRHKTSFYAPPYGERGVSGLKAAAQLDYQTILWTLDTVDWRPGSTPEVITQRILNPQRRGGVIPDKKGAIVLMHPKEATVKALPIILNSLHSDGFKAITVRELITFGQ